MAGGKKGGGNKFLFVASVDLSMQADTVDSDPISHAANLRLIGWLTAISSQLPKYFRGGQIKCTGAKTWPDILNPARHLSFLPLSLAKIARGRS